MAEYGLKDGELSSGVRVCLRLLVLLLLGCLDHLASLKKRLVLAKWNHCGGALLSPMVLWRFNFSPFRASQALYLPVLSFQQNVF